MSRFDFEPLTRGSSDELLREVLGSARRDAPTPGAKERMFAALDVVAPPPSTRPGLSASIWRGIGLRHVGIGLAIVVGATAIVMSTAPGDSREHEPATTHVMSPVEAAPLPAPSAATDMAASAASDMAAPAATDMVALETDMAGAEGTVSNAIASPPSRTEHALSPSRHAGSSAVSAPRTKAKAPVAQRSGAEAVAPSAESTLGREIARMGAARSALAGGDNARALELLDSYEAEFPLGAFSVEVSVLRIEALARSGQLDEARRLGDRFLAQHPQGAFARRVAATLRNAAPGNGD